MTENMPPYRHPSLASHMQLIMSYYGHKTAERTGVPLMNHIIEGINLLDFMNANYHTQAAYAIHPIFQESSTLENNIYKYAKEVDPIVLALAMEYRNTANSCLCILETDPWTIDDMYLNVPIPLGDVRTMLIADKIQNRKDFLEYHLNSHPRKQQLQNYFDRWLRYLDVPERNWDLLTKMLRGKQ